MVPNGYTVPSGWELSFRTATMNMGWDQVKGFWGQVGQNDVLAGWREGGKS